MRLGVPGPGQNEMFSKGVFRRLVALYIFKSGFEDLG